jgi:GAF domain-containing protein
MSSPAQNAAEDRESAVLEAFVRLADTLIADFDMIDVLHGLTTDCVALFPVEAAGLLLSDPRGVNDHGALRVVASSSEQARLVELFQLQSDEGPCLDCYRGGRPVSAPDLAEAGRWPRFTAGALEQGFRSAHAVPMRLRGRTIGALDLFGAQPGALTPADLRVAQALADLATISVLQQRNLRAQRGHAEQLHAALHHRAIIEQAKGVLAERGGLDMAAAFTQLRNHAHRTGQPLTDLARGITTRDIPTDFLTHFDS